MDAIRPEDVDLPETMVPQGGIDIEIEGVGKIGVDVPTNLFAAIGHAYAALTSKSFNVKVSDFDTKIRLLEFKRTPPYLKVAIIK